MNVLFLHIINYKKEILRLVINSKSSIFGELKIWRQIKKQLLSKKENYVYWINGVIRLRNSFSFIQLFLRPFYFSSVLIIYFE